MGVVGWGCVLDDLDNDGDGDLDIAVTSNNGPLVLLRNESGGRGLRVQWPDGTTSHHAVGKEQVLIVTQPAS